MYNFTDVTEISEGASMPSEALMINGEFIENQIAGYRTLTVSGREGLSPEIETYETGVRDGSTLKGKRYPARILTITYQIKAESNVAFREAYNKLASILNVEDAQLIFNDEKDKYYIGTPSEIGEVTPGRNCVIGEFKILCLDPFKYSTVEHEATIGTNGAVINYNGTYKSFPKLQAEFYNGNTEEDGDCGYVAFFNENAKIIQLGDPESEDIENNAFKSSQQKINNSFNRSDSLDILKNPSVAAWYTGKGEFEMGVAEKVDLGTVTQQQTDIGKRIKLFEVTSSLSAPKFMYTVYATLKARSTSYAQYTFSVCVRLGNPQSYFGTGLGIKGTLKFYYDNGTGRVDTLQCFAKYPAGWWQGVEEHWFTTEHSLYVPSKGSTLRVHFYTSRTDDTGGNAGTIGAGLQKSFVVPAYKAPIKQTQTNYFLTPNTLPSEIHRYIRPDTAGNTGATDFVLTYSQWFRIPYSSKDATGKKAIGLFSVVLKKTQPAGSSEVEVLRFTLEKSSNPETASGTVYIKGKSAMTRWFLVSNEKSCFRDSTTTITKLGSTLIIKSGGITYTLDATAIKDAEVDTVSFEFNLPTVANGTYQVMQSGLTWVKFVKHNCQTWKDIKNKFMPGDIVVADCNNALIQLNGVDAHELGALGNHWEEFYLKPGINHIGASYSSWLTEEVAPDLKVKYREVFL